MLRIVGRVMLFAMLHVLIMFVFMMADSIVWAGCSLGELNNYSAILALAVVVIAALPKKKQRKKETQ